MFSSKKHKQLRKRKTKGHHIWSPLLVIVLTLVSGCLQGDKKAESLKEHTNNAQFLVPDVSLEVLPSKNLDGWDISEANNYRFEACMIYKDTRSKAISQKFRIESKDGILQDGETDDRGCIKWQETIAFNFFGGPRYVQLERVVRGTGIVKGSQTIKVAIDPWKSTRGGSHKLYEYLNQPGRADGQNIIPSDQIITGHQEVVTALNSPFQYPLLIKGLTMDMQQERVLSNGIELSLNLEMEPWVQLQNMDGSTSSYEFKKGQFTVYASLIGTNMGNNADATEVLTPMLQDSQAQIIGGKLRAKFPNFVLERKNKTGNLVIAMNIIPNGINANVLKPYQVVHRLGDHDNWLGKSSPMADFAIEFDDGKAKRAAELDLESGDVLANMRTVYNSLMKKINVVDAAAKTNAYYDKIGLTRLEGYEFGKLDISYTSVLAGETATQRKIAYDIQVRVTEPLRGGAAAEGVMFCVRTTPKDTCDASLAGNDDYNYKDPVEAKTDGILSWDDEVGHSYYEVEHFIRKPFTFEVYTDKAEMKFTKRLDAAINPWDLFATFGKDLRYDSTANKLLKQYEQWAAGDRTVDYKIPSQFNVDKFAYTAIKFDYEINKDLSLEVKKTVLFKIDPEVQRYSSIVDGRKIEWLRDGVWLMKVAIQKDYLDPAEKGAQIIRNCNGSPEYVEPGQAAYTWQKDETGKQKCTKTVRTAKKDSNTREINDVLKVDERHFVTYQKRLVRVINGRINTPIELSMKDLRLMRIRSNLLVQLEPVDETKLGIANWLKNNIDERAMLEARLRGISTDEFIEQAFQTETEWRQWYQSNHEQDLAQQRQENAPDKLSVLKIYKDSEVSDKNKYLKGEEEMAAKRNYFNQRANIIDNILEKLDSNLIRQGYGSNRRRIINNELGRVFGEEKDISDMLMPVDSPNYIKVGKNPYASKGQGGTEDVPFKEVFWQSSNQEIDVGLLNSINEKFEMHEDDFNKLKLNDFSKESLGANFSLDLLVEPYEVSGLRKRTFIGPVTFLINSNSSHIRPTDTLAEVFCQNNSCNSAELTDRELKEWSYQGDPSFMYKRFYNSIRHFFRKNVDDLIICKEGGYIDDPTFCGSNLPYKLAVDRYNQPILNKQGVQKYEFLGYEELQQRRLDIASLLSNFIELYNLNFVSLADNPEPIYVFDINNLNCTVLTSHIGYGRNRVRNPDCFKVYSHSLVTGAPKVRGYDYLLSQLNNETVLSKEDMDQWLRSQFSDKMSDDKNKLKQAKRDEIKDICLIKRNEKRCREMRQQFLEENRQDYVNSVSNWDVHNRVRAENDMFEKQFAPFKEDFEVKITKNDLLSFIDGVPGEGPVGDRRILVKFCTWMTQRLIDQLDQGEYLAGTRSEISGLRRDILWKCLEPGKLSQNHPFLKVDEKYRVIKTGDFRFKGGKSMNINLGASLGISQSSSYGEGPSFNALKLFETGAALAGGIAGGLIPGAGLVGAAAGAVIGKHLPAVLGGSGMSYSLKWDSGRGTSNGTSVNMGTYLVMQVATFDIELKSFEKCSVLRFDTVGLVEHTPIVKFLADENISRRESYVLEEIDEARIKKQAQILESGLMLCSGEVDTPEMRNEEPRAIRERYYYFTQHFTEGDMLDAGDLYNHPWLLMLRGRRDFNVFMATLNQFAEESPRSYYDMTKNWRNVIDNPVSEPITMVKDYEWPIDNMIRTYLDVLPSFPGLYTALPNEPRDFPWGKTEPAASFTGQSVTGMGTQNIKAELHHIYKEDLQDDPDCIDPSEDINSAANKGKAYCITYEMNSEKLKEHNIEGMFDDLNN